MLVFFRKESGGFAAADRLTRLSEMGKDFVSTLVINDLCFDAAKKSKFNQPFKNLGFFFIKSLNFFARWPIKLQLSFRHPIYSIGYLISWKLRAPLDVSHL